MASRYFFVLCVQAFLLQSVCSQCFGRMGAGPCTGSLMGPLGYDGCSGVASTGGSLAVTSSSPFGPIGVSIVSENAIEGSLTAGGNLPLLGAIAVEGAFSTEGAGAVSYGCGDDSTVIISEAPIATGILAPEYFAPSASLVNQGIPSTGYNLAGVSRYGVEDIGGFGRGCECGSYY